MQRLRSLLAGPLIVFVAVFGAWQLGVDLLEVPNYILPSPVAILSSFQGANDDLLRHTTATLQAAGAGYILGNAFAFLMAAIMAESRQLESALYPWLLALRAVPIVAVAPLMIIWFGFNMWPIIVTAALISFFPSMVNAVDGFKSTSDTTMELMRGLNASRWETFRLVKFPYALPYLFSALKVSVLSAIIGAIVGEWISSDEGLGYLTIVASTYVDTLMLFRAIFVVTVLALAWFGAIVFIESRALSWRK